ncbi:hypothetical protein OBO34_07255 [Clostridiales Family XIII bacterium ASD5510]|uniref:Uncharacterized protein n=1 Tax=Hominibacterium faecale TaxID=2839743 RepID=A0A9J6QVJ6_9FIRM|nr:MULTISPECIES: hypothetical protein [Bacteria]MCU7378150.1 hypothetical protein [Hominibacterium faecale]
MNIWTAKGEKVRFLGENGMELELDEAKQNLVVGGEYTVERVNVGRWCSYVHLVEVPDKEFNSVMFENVNTKPEVVCNRDEYITWKGGQL